MWHTEHRTGGTSTTPQLPAVPDKPQERSLHELGAWLHNVAEAGGADALHRVFAADTWPGTPEQRTALFGTYVSLAKSVDDKRVLR